MYYKFLPLPARLLSRIAWGIHDTVPFRFRQRLRCNRLMAHWYKWYLGDGDDCFWCDICLAFPRLQNIIPYAYFDVDPNNEELEESEVS